MCTAAGVKAPIKVNLLREGEKERERERERERGGGVTEQIEGERE